MASVFLWSTRYLLQPKGNGSKSKSDDLGSLRLKLTYIEDTVLPSACYTPLCNLLLKSPDVKVRQHSYSKMEGKPLKERNQLHIVLFLHFLPSFSSQCRQSVDFPFSPSLPLLFLFASFSPSRRQQHTSWGTSAESDMRLFCPQFDCCSTTIALCLLSLLWQR